MIHYEKTREADEDIIAIIDYTLEHWGEQQVHSYMHGLEKKIEDIAKGEAPVKSLGEIHADLVAARYEHHMIFALQRQEQPLLILAILHEKMQMLQRLKSRLAL